MNYPYFTLSVMDKALFLRNIGRTIVWNRGICVPHGKQCNTDGVKEKNFSKTVFKQSFYSTVCSNKAIYAYVRFVTLVFVFVFVTCDFVYQALYDKASHFPPFPVSIYDVTLVTSAAACNGRGRWWYRNGQVMLPVHVPLLPRMFLPINGVFLFCYVLHRSLLWMFYEVLVILKCWWCVVSVVMLKEALCCLIKLLCLLFWELDRTAGTANGRQPPV